MEVNQKLQFVHQNQNHSGSMFSPQFFGVNTTFATDNSSTVAADPTSAGQERLALGSADHRREGRPAFQPAAGGHLTIDKRTIVQRTRVPGVMILCY